MGSYINYNFNDNTIRALVLDFMRDNDAEPVNYNDQQLILDGRIHRYKVQGDKSGDKSGAYCIFLDNWPAGWIQNWRNSPKALTWEFKRDNLDDTGRDYFTDSRFKKARELSAKHQRELEAQLEKDRAQTADKARAIADTLPNAAVQEHPYLKKKFILSAGNVKFDKSSNSLVLPLVDIDGNIKTLQYIDADGNKKFLYGGSFTGAFFPIDLYRLQKEPNLPILIGEGFATCCTVNNLINLPVVAAMTCHNLLNVAKAIKDKYPNNKIMILADNDHNTTGNPGLTAANNACDSLGLAGVITPEFKDTEKGTDWNDYYYIHGQTKTWEALGRNIEWLKLSNEERSEILEEQNARTRVRPLIQGLELNRQIPPQEFVGGIFPKKYVSLVIAPPGSGKTMFMEKFACDLSLGGTIFDGVKENEPVRKVLIFAGEAGADMLIRRGAAFKWQNNPENVIVIDQHDSEIKGVSVMLDEEEGWENVKRIIDIVKPDIVFWDTASSFHDKDENKASDMKPIIRKIASLASEKNFAAVLNHHSRKRMASERNLTLNQDDVIGSSIFNRLAALIIGMEKDLDDIENNGKVLKVRPLKTWFQFFNPFNFSLEQDFWGHPTITTDLNPKDVINSKMAVWNYLVETFTPDMWFSLEDIALDLIKPTIKERQLRNIITSLCQQGKLEKNGSTRGAKYKIQR